MARNIPLMTEVPFYPVRKDPQERFDTLIKAAVDGGATLTRELNASFIPAVNGIAADVESARTATAADREQAKTKAGEAAASAQAASSSAAAATASQNATKTSETNAKASETAAKTSETKAKASEAEAEEARQTAVVSAEVATQKAEEADTSANAASESAVAALGSKNAAKTSETNAKTSETAAKVSETNAKASESAAEVSERAAKASEANAKSSENAAKASETKAAASESKSLEAASRAETAADHAETIAGGLFVPLSRKISAGAGLSGGGDLTADRTLIVKYGTAAGTACQGNDARLSNARTPTAHAATHNVGGSDQMTVFGGNVAEKFQSLGSVSGAVSVDLTSGNIVLATIGGAVTFSFTGLVPGMANTVLLKLTNAGSAAITWPSGVRWPGGQAPTLTAAGLDVIALETDDDLSWMGVLVGADVKFGKGSGEIDLEEGEKIEVLEVSLP